MSSENSNTPEPLSSREPHEGFEAAEIPTPEELDEMSGGINLVNRASCTSDRGALNTVVSIGGV